MQGQKKQKREQDIPYQRIYGSGEDNRNRKAGYRRISGRGQNPRDLEAGYQRISGRGQNPRDLEAGYRRIYGRGQNPRNLEAGYQKISGRRQETQDLEAGCHRIYGRGQETRDHQRQVSVGIRKMRRMVMAAILLSILLLSVIFFRIYQTWRDAGAEKSAQPSEMGEGKIPRPVLDVELLTVNEYSRPAITLPKVNGIVIHYTANPGTGAMANRNYFENLKDTHATKASSHFIVGLEGEIIQCIPSSEIAYASNTRNDDTLSIECCIPDETGRFNKETYDAVIHLTAWLVEHFGLETSDIIRHYDITGKACPKYFVEFPSAWDQFLADVQAYLVSYGAA